MPHYTQLDRRRAIQRGVNFVYRTACDAENFEAYGFDYLSFFSCIALTSKDECLRKTAMNMGQERVSYWRKTHPTLPNNIDADTVSHYVTASAAAEGMGLPDDKMKSQIRRAARIFRAEDYFWFDPTIEAPPNDIPQSCECGSDNVRGSIRCGKCRKRLTMMSRYEVWLVALIRSYIGEKHGITLGARYPDVLHWMPSMRPYCDSSINSYDDFIWSLYAVTHIVYTLNDYGRYQLLPSWLPEEFKFLKDHVHEVIALDDPETVGEILDSLKSFGLTERHSLIQQGEELILSRQNPDGSWGEDDVDDIYERYHPTIAAIDGLRRNAWLGPGISFRAVKPLLQQCA